MLNWAQFEAREDYQVSVMLLDGQGHNVWQMDRPLLDRGGRGTSQWQPRGKEVRDYYLFTIPLAPPDEYRVEVALYPWETQVPVTVVEGGHGSRLEVGTLRIGRAMHQPELEALGLQDRLMVDTGQEIRLIGCDLSTQGIAQPGEAVALLPIYWQARRDVQGDYGLLVHLLHAEEELSVGKVTRLTGDAYPTTGWTKGEVLRGWYDFTLLPNILSGSYRLMAQVVDMVTGEALGAAELGELAVEAWPRSFEVPPIQHLLSFSLGGQVEFLGYDLKADHVVASDTLHLTLYWRALAGMETSYRVFTHLLGDDGRIWGQKDGFPVQGTLPTTGWVEGEVIVDEYEITVDPLAPAGDYQLEIGMYDPASGARLPITGERGEIQGDRILLKKIAVGKQ